MQPSRRSRRGSREILVPSTAHCSYAKFIGREIRPVVTRFKTKNAWFLALRVINILWRLLSWQVIVFPKWFSSPWHPWMQTGLFLHHLRRISSHWFNMPSGKFANNGKSTTCYETVKWFSVEVIERASRLNLNEILIFFITCTWGWIPFMLRHCHWRHVCRFRPYHSAFHGDGFSSRKGQNHCSCLTGTLVSKERDHQTSELYINRADHMQKTATSIVLFCNFNRALSHATISFFVSADEAAVPGCLG